jgi:hypothetical protein
MWLGHRDGNVLGSCQLDRKTDSLKNVVKLNLVSKPNCRVKSGTRIRQVSGQVRVPVRFCKYVFWGFFCSFQGVFRFLSGFFGFRVLSEPSPKIGSVRVQPVGAKMNPNPNCHPYLGKPDGGAHEMVILVVNRRWKTGPIRLLLGWTNVCVEKILQVQHQMGRSCKRADWCT